MIGYVLKLSWKNCKGLFVLKFLLTAGAGGCMAANVFFKQQFFDMVEGLIAGKAGLSAAIGWGVCMAVFLVITLIVQTVSDIFQGNYFQIIMGYLGKNLNNKASRIDPIVYEDNRLLDSINKAYVGLEALAYVADTVLYIAFKESAYFIFMGSYLFSVKPTLLAMFLLMFLPVIVSSEIRRRMYANLENVSAPYRRKYEYFGKCLYAREYAKETRLWKAEGYFENLFRENLNRATTENWKTTKKSELVEIALRFVMLLGYAGMIALMFYYLIRGEIGVGAFAAIFSSMEQMVSQMESVFKYSIANIMRQFGAAQNYFAFMDLPERNGSYTGRLERNKIELKNVSFAYPCSNKNALEDINLTIQKGETLAVVGANGSGKSTLTRLLIGLYLPTGGRIEIDGRDVSTIAPEALFDGVSSVFQRYQCYKMTVKENTQISDSRCGKEVEPVLEDADFPIRDGKFTDGTDTMLGKDFGGIDLSGGQWQRLAIARGLYRVHDMIILDEPTAAIDPIEEAGIYKKFAEISKEKTAVIVTHRLGSVHTADQILVMDAGRIVDMGAHEELMAREGKYREMYTAQAKWYA